jgi:cephalosporin-C deacetylase
MKKLFLIIIALISGLHAMGTEEIANPTPWGTTCTLTGNDYTFNGSWSGAGTWYGGKDKSAYDYVFIKFAKATGSISFSVSYNEVKSVESWGKNYYSTSTTLSETSKETIVGLKLDKTSKLSSDTTKNYAQEVLQVTLQDQGKASSLSVEGIFFATAAEYEQALINLNRGDAESGNPADTIWTGSKTIDWNHSAWQALNASLFSSAATGMTLRFYFTDLENGAQGHICTSSWKDMPSATDYFQLSGAYFEYTITDKMLAELKSNGCIVTGTGYKLSNVIILNPNKIPNMNSSIILDDIKVWEKNESPILRIAITNKQTAAVSTIATISIRTDHYVKVADLSNQVTIPSAKTDTATFDLSKVLINPGFYHITVCANYSQIADYNIGYRPTEIESPADAQSDFQEFWDKAKSDLSKVAPEYKLTKIDNKSTSNRNVYIVEMKSIDNGDGTPVTIRGYYAEPVRDGKYPVIVTQNGYDDGVATPYCPDGDSNKEMIELVLSVRGQLINNRTPYKSDNIYGDYFVYNFGDKDKYYYRGAYMDVIRGIDFIMSRSKTDTLNIFMTGGSQGGALTIVGAALDTRLNAIAPSIQFMGDFPDYFQIAGWPAYSAKQKQTALKMSDEDMYKFLSYFDTKNLAPYITCPVLTTMGLQDPVCPPHTNFAPYNNLKITDKHYTVNPFCKHEVPGSWNSDCINFFKTHLKPTTGIVNIQTDNNSNSEVKIYDLMGKLIYAGQHVSFPSDTKGIFILRSNGKTAKIIR